MINDSKNFSKCKKKSLIPLVFMFSFKFFVLKAIPVQMDTDPADVESAALGGTSVTSTEDATLFSLNPAKIGSQKNSSKDSWINGAQFPTFQIGGTKVVRKLAKFYISPPNETESESTDFGNLENHKELFGRLSFAPSLTVKRIRLSVFSDSKLYGTVQKLQSMEKSEYSTPENDVFVSSILWTYFRSDSGAAVSLSLPFKDTGLSLGSTIKYSHRVSFYGSNELGREVNSKISKKNSKLINRTRATPVDLGIVKKIGTKNEINFAALVKDFGNTYYRANATNGRSTEIDKMNIGLGASFSTNPMDTFVFSSRIEAQNLNNKDVDKKEKARGAIEIKLQDSDSKPAIKLGMGYNGHGISTGTTINLIFVKFSFASYQGRQNFINNLTQTSERRYLFGIDVDLLH